MSNNDFDVYNSGVKTPARTHMKSDMLYGYSKYKQDNISDNSSQFLKDMDSGKYIKISPNRQQKVLNKNGSEKVLFIKHSNSHIINKYSQFA